MNPDEPLDEHAQELANLLYSSLAKPNRREFTFADAKLYVVLKRVWQDEAFDYRPVLRWVWDFPPAPPKTGHIWQDRYEGTEADARAVLASLDAEGTAMAYAAALADYQKPAQY